MMFPLLLTPTVFAADTIDDLIKSEMAKRKIPGVSIVVIRDGKTIKSAGYGIANVEGNIPATTDTVYELASVTKQFTAAAVLLLMEEGKIHLEDPLSKFVSDIPDTWKPVTVRQLLNHTSGIFSLTALPDYFTPAIIRRDYPPTELLKLVADKPLDFPSGSQFRYNNSGYTLLGLVIESASGKSYGEFLTERIFKPLNMTHTRVNDFRVIIPNRAMGYSLDGTTLMNCEYVSPTHPWSAGALVSTVSDLAKWNVALNSEIILKNASKQLMWTQTKLTDGKIEGYGFGWEVNELKGHRATRHGGGIPGFSTEILRLPDDKLSIVVLTNLDSANATLIANKIAGKIIPELAPEEFKPITDPEPETTKRLRAIITKLAEKGEGQESDFTAEFWKFLYPDQLKATPRMLGSIAPSEFTLVKRREENDLHYLTYRAAFGTNLLIVTISLTKDNKIAGMEFHPE